MLEIISHVGYCFPTKQNPIQSNAIQSKQVGLVKRLNEFDRLLTPGKHITCVTFKVKMKPMQKYKLTFLVKKKYITRYIALIQK